MFSSSLLQELNTLITQVLGGFQYILPQLLLSIWILVMILVDIIWRRNSLLFWICMTLFSSVLFLILSVNQYLSYKPLSSPKLFFEMLQVDSLGIFFHLFFWVALILTIWLSYQAPMFQENYPFKGEYFVLLFGIVLGLQLLVLSTHFLMLYLSLELVSICSYMLTILYFNKKSVEGAIKYLIFGGFSSALMLYSISLLYGLSGTLSFDNEGFTEIFSSSYSWVLIVALGLSMTGFLFKISSVPLHFWTPDVYQAAPTVLVAFFSVASKAGGLMVLWRFSESLSSITFTWNGVIFQWQDGIALLALISIMLGNFSALRQKDAKRMMAYSAIAQAGFLMIGLLSPEPFVLQSFLFYLVVYGIISFGAFAMIQIAEANLQTTVLTSYQGLGVKNPVFGVLFLVMLIALAGLPPTAGFTAKLLVFSSLWEVYVAQSKPLYLILLIAGVLNTAVALFYYLKIPYFLFFKEDSSAGFLKIHWLDKLLLYFLGFLTISLFFMADGLLKWLVNF